MSFMHRHRWITVGYRRVEGWTTARMAVQSCACGTDREVPLDDGF